MSVAFAQQLEMVGRVYDKQTNDNLVGANVVIKGTNLGAVTDVDGKFHIILPNTPSATIIVSYIGYKTVKKFIDGSRFNLSFGLLPDILKTSEVVVSGLASSVKKKNAANSVAVITGKELTEVPTQTLDQQLAGKFAGVSVNQNSGAPGGGMSVNLRGVTTINAGSQPLYILDGVILDNTATQSGVNAVTLATGGGAQIFKIIL